GASVFFNNNATNCTIRMLGSQYNNNSAQGFGGAASVFFGAVMSGGDISLCGAQYQGNTAKFGGALVFGAECFDSTCPSTHDMRLTVCDSEFTANTAQNLGGAVFLSPTGSNQANVALTHSSLVLTNCSFAENTGDMGGAVAVTSGSLTNATVT